MKLMLAACLVAIAAVYLTPSSVISEYVVPYFLVLFEKNLVPDWLTRVGIRMLCKGRLNEILLPNVEQQQASLQGFIDELKGMPIAINTADANEQHYEVNAAFYNQVLGKHLKYSSGLYPVDTPQSEAAARLDEAESAMLATYMRRANVSDSGLRILDLGCGWGSVSLYVAEHFPSNQVVGLSNSNSQREFIMGEAKKRGISNLEIVTGNIVEFEMPKELAGFDRVISIEMMEHMKNYQLLLRKVASWMKPQALMFVHIFVHRLQAYHFEVRGEDDWMSKYFFTGGTMPSADTLFYFQQDLRLLKHWHVNGVHYGLTSEAWLQNLDSKHRELWPVLKQIYGEGQETLWYARWRGFFLACAELFKYDGGNEWFVAHYLFQK